MKAKEVVVVEKNALIFILNGINALHKSVFSIPLNTGYSATNCTLLQLLCF